ncbi:MAG: peptide-methionine (S)-S-oxide reductase [Chlorobiaceae bacterium]|nr:peptide-methionine (S)-S-oxide reductase [Chlorobiaceae bacterium]
MIYSLSKMTKIIVILLSLFVLQLNLNAENNIMEIIESAPSTTNKGSSSDTATFGAGCFWCVEAIYQQLDGVLSVTSGYMGGSVVNPSYEDVCTGETGHAEVCRIVYDPKKITFDELLEVFWSSHDPTTLNRQGSDIGTQYRSVIFYHTQKQKELAEKYKKKLNAEHAFEKPVITEISAEKEFYKAENYHQNYFNDNSNKPYCQFVIRPKLDKFEKIFKSKIKMKH